MDEFSTALNRSYFFLKFRPRTKKEVIDYLHQKQDRFGWKEETIQAVLKHLTELELIDDQAFIEWFVQQRSQHRPKSRFALINELVRYGISKEQAAEYLEVHNLDEAQLALEALSKKWDRFAPLDSREQFTKAASYLSRRGFSIEIIKKTIAKMRENE